MSSPRLEITSTDDDYIDLEAQDEVVTFTPPTLNKATKVLVGLAMLTNAICMAGLNTTSLHSLHYPLPFAITSASISIFTELGLSQTFTVPGIEEIASIIKQGKLPNHADHADEWPIGLPWTTEASSLLIATFCLGVSSYHYGGQVFYWANTLPNADNYNFEHRINTSGWKILSGLCASGVVTNLLFGQGLETYKVLRRRFSGKSPLHYDSFRDIFSLGLGNLLIGIPYAIAVSLMNIQGSIEAQPFTRLSPTLFTTMALTIADASGSYCLNGLFIPQVIHDFLSYLKDPSTLNAKQIMSLLLAVGLSGLHSYTQFQMSLSVLNVLSRNLGLEHYVTTWIGTTFSILYAEGEFITANRTLYNGIHTLTNLLTNLCASNRIKNEEERPLLANHASPSRTGLFATINTQTNSEESILEEENPKQYKCRCTIL